MFRLYTKKYWYGFRNVFSNQDSGDRENALIWGPYNESYGKSCICQALRGFFLLDEFNLNSF